MKPDSRQKLNMRTKLLARAEKKYGRKFQDWDDWQAFKKENNARYQKRLSIAKSRGFSSLEQMAQWRETNPAGVIQIKKRRQKKKDNIAQFFKNNPTAKQHPLHDFIFATEDGRIFSTRIARFLTPTKNEKTGYYQTSISKKLTYVHRAVWECFHGTIQDDSDPRSSESLTIDHIDGDKKNNSITNLRLISKKENRQAAAKYVTPYGITWIKKYKIFRPQFFRGGKMYQGSKVGEKNDYKNLDEAIRVRDLLADMLGIKIDPEKDNQIDWSTIE